MIPIKWFFRVDFCFLKYLNHLKWNLFELKYWSAQDSMFSLHQANSSTRGSQQQLSSNETSTSTTSSTLDSFVMRNAWKIRQIQKTINKYPIKVKVEPFYWSDWLTVLSNQLALKMLTWNRVIAWGNQWVGIQNQNHRFQFQQKRRPLIRNLNTMKG